MNFNYCPECGSSLGTKQIGDEGLLPFCTQCEKPFFDIVKSSVLIAVINEFNEVVLLRQNSVSQTHWVLVAGYLKKAETLEEAVVREVREETGLEVKSCSYISSYFFEPKELTMMGFVVVVEKKAFGSSNEVDQIGWFSFDEAEQLLKEGSLAKKHFCKARRFIESTGV